MFRKFVTVIFFVLTIPLELTAGTPFEENVKCPSGFGRAKFTSTMSCSSRGDELYMGGKRPSSCEFVTVLPVCSKQGLPLYTKFQKEDAKPLRELAKSQAYQDSLSRTRFERAALVDETLGRMTVEDRFWLLQQGFWSEPSKTYGDAAYFEIYKAAANAYLETVDPATKPWVVVFASYAQAQLGEVEKATKLLSFAKTYSGDNAQRVRFYAKQVEACFADMTTDSCQPFAKIIFPE